MIIIAFSNKTSKILPKLLCKNFKHCAPIIRTNSGLVMFQFVKRGHIYKIKLRDCDIRRMAQMGWKFIYLSNECNRPFRPYGAWTCVGLAKNALGMRNFAIQTPDALYNHLK